MNIAKYMIIVGIVLCVGCSRISISIEREFDLHSYSRIVLLGTGTPNAEPDRSGTAIAIIVNDTPYIIDCGPGVVRRANAANLKRGIKALRPENLKHLFITHLHSDHTVGYPDFIFTPWTLGRDAPLKVFGPTGTKKMTDHILAAYDEDIHLRVDGLEPANTEGYKVEVSEIKSGIVYRDENVTVKAFPVHHGSWKHAFGFRFETPDRVIVVSGDTTPVPTLIEAAQGCDVLLHEVYSKAGFDKRNAIWKKYHSSFHTSTIELADIANMIKPKQVILYHQLFWGATDQDLLNEIRQTYSGKVVSGKDLDVF